MPRPSFTDYSIEYDPVENVYRTALRTRELDVSQPPQLPPPPARPATEEWNERPAPPPPPTNWSEHASSWSVPMWARPQTGNEIVYGDRPAPDPVPEQYVGQRTDMPPPVPQGITAVRAAAAEWSDMMSHQRAAMERLMGRTEEVALQVPEEIASWRVMGKPKLKIKEPPMTFKEKLVYAIRHLWYRRGNETDRVAKVQQWAIKKGLVSAVKVKDGRMALAEHADKCDCCGEMTYTRDARNFVSARDFLSDCVLDINKRGGAVFGQVCTTCARDKVFYCHMQGSQCMSDKLTPISVFNHGTCCLELNAKKLAKHPDGMYVDITTNQEYHHGYRNWDYNQGRLRSQCKLESEIKAKCLYGAELEIMARSDASALAIRRAAVELGLAAERDGSLDQDYGIEIIGQPMTYDEITGPNSVWRKFLDAIRNKALGWDAGQTYGMHVNLNRIAFSLIEVSKYVTFVNENRSLAELVGGRPLNSYCNGASAKDMGGLKASLQGWLADGGYGDDINGVLDYFHCNNGSVPVAETTKYLAAAIRSKARIEVRMFRSTIRWDRFKRNIQFADSVRQYILQASNQDYLAQQNYLDWMSVNQHHYPELSAFLYCSSLSSRMKAPPAKKTLELQPSALNVSDGYVQPAPVRFVSTK